MYVCIYVFIQNNNMFIHLRLFIVWYHCKLHSVSSPFFCIYQINADIQVSGRYTGKMRLTTNIFVNTVKDRFRFSIHNAAF